MNGSMGFHSFFCVYVCADFLVFGLRRSKGPEQKAEILFSDNYQFTFQYPHINNPRKRIDK